MSATISSSGTWTAITGLSTGKTGEAAPGGINDNRALGLNFESLKTMDGTILPELEQFIQLVATGYGLTFHSASNLVEILLRAYKMTTTPRRLGDAGGSRLFIS